MAYDREKLSECCQEMEQSWDAVIEKSRRLVGGITDIEPLEITANGTYTPNDPDIGFSAVTCDMLASITTAAGTSLSFSEIKQSMANLTRDYISFSQSAVDLINDSVAAGKDFLITATICGNVQTGESRLPDMYGVGMEIDGTARDDYCTTISRFNTGGDATGWGYYCSATANMTVRGYLKSAGKEVMDVTDRFSLRVALGPLTGMTCNIKLLPVVLGA